MNLSNEEAVQNIMLSICVVSYNHEPYIKKCLDCILEQQMQFSYEIVVGNDYSTDRTAQVLEEYKDQIRAINRSKNLGMSANLYDLLLQARGKYVFMIAGDDYLCNSEALQKQVDFLENHKEYHAISAWNYTFRESDGKMYDNYVKGSPTEFTLEDFLNGVMPPVAFSMMRNTFAEDQYQNQYLISGARNNEEMKLWLYTLRKGKTYIMHEYFHVYCSRDDGNSYTSTHTWIDAFRDNYDDLCILREWFKGVYNFTPIILKRSNYYCIRLSDNLKNLIAFVRVMKFWDAIKLFGYKCYLALHSYNDPPKWENRDYLILKDRG